MNGRICSFRDVNSVLFRRWFKDEGCSAYGSERAINRIQFRSLECCIYIIVVYLIAIHYRTDPKLHALQTAVRNLHNMRRYHNYFETGIYLYKKRKRVRSFDV
jgi:hypothetical protein